jgi:hypothetical protein
MGLSRAGRLLATLAMVLVLVDAYKNDYESQKSWLPWLGGALIVVLVAASMPAEFVILSGSLIVLGIDSLADPLPWWLRAPLVEIANCRTGYLLVSSKGHCIGLVCSRQLAIDPFEDSIQKARTRRYAGGGKRSVRSLAAFLEVDENSECTVCALRSLNT